MTKFYVYLHIDPVTDELVYIGVGSGSRAWTMGSHRISKASPAYGRRNAEHHAWMESLIDKKYLPTDWVSVPQRNLSKEDAMSIEYDLITKHQPRFNKMGTEAYRKSRRQHPHEVSEFAKALHDMGYGYQRIAFLLGSEKPKNNVMGVKRMVSYV